jgi:hypothetical protein
MGFSNLGGCFSIHTYDAARLHFARTPAPKAKRRGSSVWSDNQRPLDDERKHHYRIEHHTYPERTSFSGEPIPAQDFYDVCLYSTCMVRYHRPEENGDRRIDYTNHSTNLSKQFMWRMGFGPELALSLPGEVRVLAPVAYKELGTTIWYDEDRYLIKEKSHHAPVYKYVSSPEQKAWRKTLKDSTRNLVTLFEIGMQLPEPGGGRWGRHDGAPFKGVNVLFSTRQALRHFDGEVTESTTHLQIEALKHVWDACLQFLVDKRDYAAEGRPTWSWNKKESAPYKAPTPQEVTRSWYTQIEKLCCRERAASERIPDWPTAEQLPKKYHF